MVRQLLPCFFFFFFFFFHSSFVIFHAVPDHRQALPNDLYRHTKLFLSEVSPKPSFDILLPKPQQQIRQLGTEDDAYHDRQCIY